MVPHVHGLLCDFLTNPIYGRFREGCFPRSWFKTWVGTVGGSIWLTLPDEEGMFKSVFPYKGPNVRILIASNISDNAEKMIDKIRHEWMDNDRLCSAFPDLVPVFNKVRWSNSCAMVNRPGKFTEGTYTSVGVGGGVISQHFDHILEDDLVYAKKDDFSGVELMPNQEDIDKAIGWHKLAFSLLVDPKKSGIWNIGTRWAPKDLVNHIRENEKHYTCFELAVTKFTELPNGGKTAKWPIEGNEDCVWPERYDLEALELIEATQGHKIYETQYLNRPRAAEDTIFEVEKVRIHESIDSFPDGLRWVTYADLAGWRDSKRTCNNVVLTAAKSKNDQLYIARVDYGKFNPSDMIEVMRSHALQFSSKVLIEEVGYQSALRHFVNKSFEDGKPRFSVDALKFDQQKNAKMLRIQRLQPYVNQCALHIIRGMKLLLNELTDYPYSQTCDILDLLGFAAKSTTYSDVEDTAVEPGFFAITRESLEEECHVMAKSNRESGMLYPFSAQVGDLDYSWRVA
jgi:hypothetical protein